MMSDSEKVIKGLQNLRDAISTDFIHEADQAVGTIDDALALIKEQEDLGTELTNAVELIHKKNERIEKLLKEQETHKFFVDESGKITPLPVVVRCKDCKYNDDGECIIKAGWFPVKPDWFCADGERKGKG